MVDTKTVYITVTPPAAGISNTGSDISSTLSDTAEAGISNTRSDIPSSSSGTSQPEVIVYITSTATQASIATTTDTQFSNTISTSSATSKSTPLYTTGKGLSSGAKAGIAVGVIQYWEYFCFCLWLSLSIHDGRSGDELQRETSQCYQSLEPMVRSMNYLLRS
ncbi:hypothetical protein N7493_005492 [Penicillium malachiteum]|uniref:Uncharacterized protein n=1 Tax=Penicillium malachiteum TaxID=1324776 RepID=A0AAD6HN43_9EURO|nr:hypothetical protein N7493_005492 [Penicillium malachiteum]